MATNLQRKRNIQLVKLTRNKKKLEDLKKQISEARPENPIETMKLMNVSADVIQQVQEKLEIEARDKVREIIGINGGYETYD